MSDRSFAFGVKGIYVDRTGNAGFVQQVATSAVHSYVADLRQRWTGPDPVEIASDGTLSGDEQGSGAAPPARNKARPRATESNSGGGVDGSLDDPRGDERDLRATIDDRLALLVDGDAKKWANEETVEELRTLWVDFDESGRQHKAWPKVTLECANYRLGRYPHHGPPAALNFVRFISDDYENPRRWFQACYEKYHISERDRL